jgi:hypothetical protein
MIEIPDQQHWQAAVGSVEFGMFLEANTSQSASVMQIVDAHRDDGKRYVVRADE